MISKRKIMTIFSLRQHKVWILYFNLIYDFPSKDDNKMFIFKISLKKDLSYKNNCYLNARSRFLCKVLELGATQNITELCSSSASLLDAIHCIPGVGRGGVDSVRLGGVGRHLGYLFCCRNHQSFQVLKQKSYNLLNLKILCI